jgi:hypothetical protein
VAYLKVHLGISNKEMKIRAWSKLILLINFWPGYKDISCVTDDPNQAVFVSLFVSCFISRFFDWLGYM